MSTPLIIRDFSFARDFRKIQWRATLWYNLLRASCAGLVIGVLLFIFPQNGDSRFMGLGGPLLWPIVYLIVFLPMGVVFSILREVPFVWSFIGLLFICCCYCR